MSLPLVNISEPQEEDLKACRGCLATGVDLHNLQGNGLGQVFAEFTTIAVLPGDGYPQYICTVCQHLVRKFLMFRMKCHTAMWTLQQMRIIKETITTEKLINVDRTYLKLNIKKSSITSIDIPSELNEENKQNDSFDEVNLTEENGEENSATISVINKVDDCISNINNRVKRRSNKIRKKNVKATKHDLIKEDNVISSLNQQEFKNEEINNEKFEITFVKEELDDYDGQDGNINEYDYINDFTKDTNTTESTIKTEKSVKDEESKKDNKRNTKKGKRKTRKKDKPEKRTKASKITNEKKIEKREDEENINKLWSTINDEINTENNKNQNIKRKPLAYADVKFSMKKAEKFSESYNMDVKFLSIEEQRREIEERRQSDNYKFATYRCEQCARVFVLKDTYTRHMRLHDPQNGDFECEICQYRFDTRLKYMKHFNHLHTRKIICRDCGVVKRYWTAAQKHFEWHRGTKINCELCDRQFSERKLFLMHMLNKHKEGTVCVLCKDTFNGAAGVKVHMDKSHRESARCTSCNAVFINKEALSKHMEGSQDCCPPGNRSCPICGTNFSSERLLDIHHFEEHAKNQFKCDQCPKIFPSQKQRTRHAQEHRRRVGRTGGTILSGPRRPHVNATSKPAHEQKNVMFVCEVCGKEKRSLADLKYHQRVHTGERPFQCDYCQKTFHMMQSLKNHIKIHTDERNYKCPVCSKAFRQLGHKQAHLLTHTKERPFGCSACSKRYTSSSALRDHVDTAHRGLPGRQWGRNKCT